MVIPFLILDSGIITEDNDFLLQNIEADRKLQNDDSPAKSAKSSAIAEFAEVKIFADWRRWRRWRIGCFVSPAPTTSP